MNPDAVAEIRAILADGGEPAVTRLVDQLRAEATHTHDEASALRIAAFTATEDARRAAEEYRTILAAIAEIKEEASDAR